jgi:hypothetical protein
VLVVDLAHHRLEQVLDGGEAVGAPVLVDDEGHVDALGLHPLRSDASGMEGGDVEERAQERAQVEGLPFARQALGRPSRGAARRP